MSQSGYTPLALYYSTTPGMEPDPAKLVEGELALNITDGYLFYKRSGVIKNLAGLSGYSGKSGYSGFSGISGYSGTGGTGGTSGFSGYSGSGISGYSGFSGYSGAVGTGTSGYSGYSGTAGSSILSTANSFTNTNSFTSQVAIGSTSFPAGSALYVKGGNSNNFLLDNGGQQYTSLAWLNNGVEKAQTFWDQTNSLFVTGTDVAAAYVFKTNTVERMRISSAGGVSVGTSTDAGVGNILVNGAYKTTNFSISESGGKLYFYNGATAIASLDSFGNFTALGSNVAGGTP